MSSRSNYNHQDNNQNNNTPTNQLSSFYEENRYQIKELKLTIKQLNEKYRSQIVQINTIQTEIEKFNTMHSMILGSLIQDILRLKKDIHKKLLDKNEIFTDKFREMELLKMQIHDIEIVLKTMDNKNPRYDGLQHSLFQLNQQLQELEANLFENRIFKAYQKARDNFKSYNEQFESDNTENSNNTDKDDDTNYNKNLNDDETKDLKSLWKKACKLCHPDIVKKSLQSQANEIMQELNCAYSNNDIQKVKEILQSLEDGYLFDSEDNEDTEISAYKKSIIEDIPALKLKIQTLKTKIAKLQIKLKNFHIHEVYITIKKYPNLNSYFEELKNELEDEKSELMEELEDIK
jgi:hypothetical protein